MARPAPGQPACTARSVLRYPKDYKDEALRGEPILDEDGARQYKPCESAPMHGQRVCQSHGGKASQSIAAAKKKMLEGVEDVAAVLKRKALDERLNDDTRIKWVNSYLDRVGIRTGAEIAVEIPLWQQRLGRMFGTPDDSATPDESESRGSEASEVEPGAAPSPPRVRAKAARPAAPTEREQPTRRTRVRAAQPQAKSLGSLMSQPD